MSSIGGSARFGLISITPKEISKLTSSVDNRLIDVFKKDETQVFAKYYFTSSFCV